MGVIARLHPKNAYKAYKNRLEKNPVLTKCVTAGVLNGSADVVCQQIEKKFGATEEEKNKRWDYERSIRICIAIGTINNPVVQLYSNYIGPLVKATCHFGTNTKMQIFGSNVCQALS